MTPISPLESGVEHLGMYQRGKPFFAPASSLRSSLERPVSIVSEAYTDIEDDSSEFEEYSLSSVSDSDLLHAEFHMANARQSDNRRSQTTISTFEEVRTPGGTPSEEIQPQFADRWYLPKSVEGPKGPHLFRVSQLSNDMDFALQMSPLFPKDQAAMMQAAFLRETTPDTIVPRKEYNSIANAVAHLDTAEVRAWTSREVSTWMYQNGFEQDIIDRFRLHDITGAILLDLQFEDLKELEIQSFGKRHQLWNQIDSLRTGDGLVSPVAPAPVPTPFEDISRPCTGARNRSKSKGRERRNRDKSRGPKVCEEDPTTPGGFRRRGRQNRNGDIVTPAESVSIVAIEQLLPKPHKCAKGENCSKWRKQQRQLARLQDEHGFPISPEKGGRIFIAGDPGNAQTATRAVDHVYRPTSDAVPSLVASSDLLGPEQLPDFLLEEDMLKSVDRRDPQDNVRQFLALQGLENPYATATPIEAPATPPIDMFSTSRPSYIPMYPELSGFSTSNSSAPSAHTSVSYEPSNLPPAPLHPPEFTPAPHHNLKTLPRLAIPRSMSAGPSNAQPSITPTPHTGQTVIETFSPCRTASPGGVYRFGTPFSEMDAPVTAIPIGPVSRDTSQSVPPNMQYRDPIQRPGSTRDWRRPSLPLPALNEDQVFDPAAPAARNLFDDTETLHGTRFSGASSADSTPVKTAKPTVGSGSPRKGSASGFVYEGVAHHGWMKKRRTKLLRHEWQDHHFRLNGTLLAMHNNELPSSSALQTIDVDDYAVACSSLASNKLSAKLRALKISTGHKDKDRNPTPAFEFQLVPTAPGKGEAKKIVPHGKMHHFAVKSKDDRIDWMRELMLAKAIKAKGDGYEVNVNGTDV